MANAIATLRGYLPSGQTVEYSDANARHVRQQHFAAIMASDPVRVEVVTVSGSVFGVNLPSGELTVGSESFVPEVAAANLRPVYYKQMRASMDGSGVVMDYFVIGWQGNVGGVNVRRGLKVFGDRYELTGEI